MIQYLNVFFYDIYPYLCGNRLSGGQLAALRLRAVDWRALIQPDAG